MYVAVAVHGDRSVFAIAGRGLITPQFRWQELRRLGGFVTIRRPKASGLFFPETSGPIEDVYVVVTVDRDDLGRLDHLGVRDNAKGDDKIFNGADDDASGCVAVLELARVLANGKRPKRTIYFAFFGSEEAGGYGSKFFVNNLPFAKENIAANLQFEMLGRPDVKVGKDELWLTGYERSNLGAELAKQGAKLVKDPHPQENFFQRSDNYTLAKEGVVAHTVSSFGLHKDYHQASDEIETMDFEYMTNAVNSMVKPVQWLVNSNFKPTWYEGMRP